jgi:hypothetical protein
MNQNNPAKPRAARSKIAWAEVSVGLLACFVVAGLLITAMLHAGPLWRDEINTRWIALQPLSEIWSWLEMDSYPFVWFMVVRGWVLSGLGETDQGLRVLGAITGMLSLIAMVFSSRLISKRWPLLLLALFALHPLLFRFGSSLRGHGPGTVLMFLMVGVIWSYVDRPNTKRFFWVFFLSLLAVQSLYYNAVILAAALVAGGGTCLLARRYRDFFRLAAVGFTCALSILPYVLGPMVRARSWNEVVKVPTSVGSLLKMAAGTIDLSCQGQVWLWLLAGGVVYLGCVATLFKLKSNRRKSRAMFIVIAAPVLFAVYLGFLLLLSYGMQPWYFMTFLAFSAFLIDRGADLLIGVRPAGRVVRLGLVLIMIVWLLPGDLTQAKHRATNIDVIANTITENGGAGDVVVVAPWYLGVTFSRYYHGEAEMITVPPIADFRLHRYALYREALMHPDAIEPIKEKIRSALASGHRVWYVGTPRFPDPGRRLRPIPTPPEFKQNWGMYEVAWEGHLGEELAKDGRMSRVAISVPQPVSSYEQPALFVFEGKWNP